ncbi:MAG: hydroxyacid dehydrogenase [Spirochaetales bacterium]|nr:hydroxyacid dehydrogenase [Spirochaetales bacterium]
MIKIWTNTKTLDGYLDGYTFTELKEEANIALIGGKTIDLSEFPNLRVVFRAGISKDNLPFEQAEKQNVRIYTPSDDVAEYIYDETANFTVYLILRMLYQNTGTLDPWEKYGRTALQNKKLLLIGLGKIGQKVQTKMQSMMNVITFDVLKNSSEELADMISSADCISIHIPNTPDNKGFINTEKLALMKDNAILVNTARGPIVDENALYKELKNNRIKAAFDVYWKEPYAGKLKEFYPDLFFMTPHIASTCNEFLSGAAENLKAIIKELAND